jgi:hypothetical protein
MDGKGEDAVPAEVTHVVCPRSEPTHRIIYAALSGRWIVPDTWVAASAAAGYFLPEGRSVRVFCDFVLQVSE